MIPMCAPDVRERLIAVLQALELPTQMTGDLESVLNFTNHDKKCEGSAINAVFVDEIASCRIEKMPLSNWQQYIREQIGG